MVSPRYQSLQCIPESDEGDQTHRLRDLETQAEENQQHRAREMENLIDIHQEQRARDIEHQQEQRARDIENHLEEHQEQRARDLENQLEQQEQRTRDMEDHIESQQEHIIQNIEEAEIELMNLRRGMQLAIDTHQKALEDLVNVNSLFTIATFVGLTIAQPNEKSLETRAECEPDNEMGKRLILSEVIAFAFFMMSSLVAKTLKVHLNVCKEEDFGKLSYTVGRGVMLMLAGWGSILGCVFLTTSMVEIIQLKVGKLSCGSEYTYKAVGALIGIVLLALGIYVPFVMHTIYISLKKSPL